MTTTIDEMIAVLQAVKEGKKIEYKNKRDLVWSDCPCPSWDWVDYDFRIKPEPHYRHFESAEELMEAIEKHGDWIRYKGAYCRICVVYGSCCDFNGFSLTYKDAIRDAKFKDGTPFGKLVEE